MNFIGNMCTLRILWITILLSLFNSVLPIKVGNAKNSTRLKQVAKPKCKNNGNLTLERCICPKPWTGKTCEKTTCVNGIPAIRNNSDPLQPPFNPYCICNVDWTGELCEESLIDRCNGQGKTVNSTCFCNQNFTGEHCEFVNCRNGNHSNGRCACNSGWTGVFCDEIICQQGGSPYEAANNTRCNCLPQYRGRFCGFCRYSNTTSFPECKKIAKPVHIGSHAVNFLKKDFVAIIIVSSVMLSIVVIMCVLYGLTKRKAKLERQVEIDQRESVRQRLMANKAEADRYFN